MYRRSVALNEVAFTDSRIIVPVDIQSRFKTPMTLVEYTVTANGSTMDFNLSMISAMEVQIKVVSVSGTTPTLNVYIEGKFEGSGDYRVIASQENITTTGSWFLTVNPLVFRYIRVRWTVGGTGPSFGLRVYAQGMS